MPPAAEPIRIAMWSGPRNISTAMMRSFENREDTAIADEPFYAAFLAATGIDHPMRDETLASQPQDWRDVIPQILGPVPGAKPVFYQKHMTHHMVGGFGRDWIAQCRNAFLIRAPEDVLASYTQKRAEVALADIGFVQQCELFEREADRLGRAPPVIASDDVLANPRGAITKLCSALDIPFSERMLTWPAGRRDTDGVWSAVWYEAVERSTGFARPRAGAQLLNDAYRYIADQACPYYERLLKFKIEV